MSQRVDGMHLLGSIRQNSVAMTFQSGVGQQINQRTIYFHQGRPQIRVHVTGHQVVYADQDDRVQDDDLASKTISSLGHALPKIHQGALSLLFCASVLSYVPCCSSSSVTVAGVEISVLDSSIIV